MHTNSSNIDLSIIVESLQDIICSFQYDPSPRLVFINEAIATHTLYNPNEFYADPALFLRIIHPEDRSLLKGVFLPGMQRPNTFRMIRRDGAVLQVHASYSDLHRRDLELSSTQMVIRILSGAGLPEGDNNQKKLVNQRIQRYLEELSIIADIGRTIGENLNLDEIYSRLGSSVQRMFPDAPIFFISRYMPEIQKIACAYGMVDGELLEINDIPLADLDPSEQGTQTRVILEGKPLIIPDLIAHRGGSKNPGIVLGAGDESQIPRSSMLVPMLVKNQVLGVVQVQSTSINRFNEDDVRLLEVVANVAASLIHSASVHQLLMEAYDKTLEGWGQAVDLRDRETSGHSMRVAELTVEVAKRMGIFGEELVNIRRGALMHDIGKIGVPDAILLKNGPLELDEIMEMRKHPQYANEMLKNITFMKGALDIPNYHHEKWDGTGYPHHLQGYDIPLSARIFTVVDVYDALISDRPYRRAYTKQQSMEYISANSGSYFDPDVSKIFLEMMNQQGSKTR